MKKTRIIIVLAVIAIIAAIIWIAKGKSSGTGMTMDYQDDPSEIVDAQKACYAADVLAVIDSLAGQWSEFAASHSSPIDVILTTKEKLKQPDYLMAPSVSNTLVTKNQKVCATAILIQDRGVRMAYGMPVADIDAAVMKLALDLNFPVSAEELLSKDLTASENVSLLYNRFKENLELETFWEFCGATLNETEYILSCDPDLYLSKIDGNTWSNYNSIWKIWAEASAELGKYDSEMALINTMLHRGSVLEAGDEASVFEDLNSAPAFYHKYAAKIADRRNKMLTE